MTQPNLTPVEKAHLLPENPGVYRFYNSEGIVIYVGKAKNLKRRVLQYFQKTENLTRKTAILVSKIADLQHTVVESEEDALLLENNLIKEYQPRYNILLKDGKTYPWIVIKKERFPRIFMTRTFIKDGSLYFGPYSSVKYAHGLLDLINSIYRLRSCKNRLTEEGIANGRFSICLDYHIKKCLGPCIGEQTEEDYMSQIEEIKQLLKGETSKLIRDYTGKMKAAAAELEFEKAHEYKQTIELLQKHYSKSLIVQPNIGEIDIFSLVSDGKDMFGNFMRIRSGCIVQSLNRQFKLKVEETEAEVMRLFIGEIYSITGTLSHEIVVSHLPEEEIPGKDIHLALRGDKLNLLKLSTKNANAMKFDVLKQQEITNPEEHSEKIVSGIKRDLQLIRMPYWMECFDNSNIQGTNPVAACVVFKNGKPSKKDYRHFNIKTVVGANDFASMYEILTRRYSRLKEEGNGFPQLIVIDGGKGQVGMALKAIADLGIEKEVEVIGLAERLEEIIIPGDSNSLFLDKNSTTLKVLMHIRDEAHRFGITFHRSKRTKHQADSILRTIEGVGEATEEKLLRRFKSVKRIREAEYKDLEETVGPKLAARIQKALNQAN